MLFLIEMISWLVYISFYWEELIIYHIYENNDDECYRCLCIFIPVYLTNKRNKILLLRRRICLLLCLFRCQNKCNNPAKIVLVLFKKRVKSHTITMCLLPLLLINQYLFWRGALKDIIY